MVSGALASVAGRSALFLLLALGDGLELGGVLLGLGQAVLVAIVVAVLMAVGDRGGRQRGVVLVRVRLPVLLVAARVLVALAVIMAALGVFGAGWAARFLLFLAVAAGGYLGLFRGVAGGVGGGVFLGRALGGRGLVAVLAVLALAAAGGAVAAMVVTIMVTITIIMVVAVAGSSAVVAAVAVVADVTGGAGTRV